MSSPTVVPVMILVAMASSPTGIGVACDVAFRGERFVAPPPMSALVARRAPAIWSPGAEPALRFVRHDVDPGPYGQVTEGINVGDVDGDGRPDVVQGGDFHLLWFHSPDLTPRLIATDYKYAGGAMVVVRDMDGDGRQDVLTGRFPLGRSDLRETVWFANTPDGWKEHRLSSTSYCHDLAFGDLDGDGDVDAACDDQFLDEIVWLEAPADPTELWTTHLIDARSAMGNEIADIDRDGRLDVVAGRAWYARADDGTWSRHPYTELVDDADRRFDDFEKITVLDIDGDGRLDVFATLFTDSREGRVHAFLAPPDPTGTWTSVEIDPGPLFGVHSQAAADFDGTGRVQVMVGETNIGGFGFGPNPAPRIYVYRLVGAASDPAGWERTLVDTTGTHEARAVDLNADGFPDIVGDEENTDLLDPPRNGVTTCWWNAPPPPPTTTSTSTTTTTAAVPTTTRPTTTTRPPPPADDCRSAVGPAAVRCRIDDVLQALDTASVGHLGGARVARRLALLLYRAQTLADDRSDRKRLRSARRQLASVVALVERARARKGMAPTVADRLTALATEAIDALRALMITGPASGSP